MVIKSDFIIVRELGIGKKYNVKLPQEKLTLKFVTIFEDSRCPSDVNCIEEGQVKVVLNINQIAKMIIS
jgi:hypothetical protein